MKRYQAKYRPYSERRTERKLRRNLLLTIFITSVLLYFLITWFIPTLVSGLSVLNQFKDQPKAIVNLTEKDILAPPVLNISYEATNTATITIKGYSSPETQVEIYLDDGLQGTAEVKKDGSFTSDEINLAIGTNNIYGKTVNNKGEKSLPSKTIRIFYDFEKPKLEIKEPHDNQTFQGERKIKVAGTTEPNTSVDVNGIRVIVDSEGNFSHTLELQEGENSINITSKDQAGNTTQTSLKATFQP